METNHINIIAVFAHPDDEVVASGVLIRAKEMGHTTHLVCATRGEACRIKNKEVMNENNKIEVRTKELEESCKVIGVSTLNFLDLPDSKGAEWKEDIVEERLIELFYRVKPKVIITLPENGGNGHPDHKAISKLTVNAFNKYKVSNGGELYFLSPYPESLFNRLLIAKILPGKILAKIMKNNTTKDENVTDVIELTRVEVKTKFLALEKHKSQFPDEKGRYYKMPKTILKIFTKYECYSKLNEDKKKENKVYKRVQMLR